MSETSMLQPVRVPGLTLGKPEAWERLDVPGTELVLAESEKAQQPGDFRPNVVLLAEPGTASIQQISTRTMASAMADAGETYMISCDNWPGVHPARRLQFTHTIESAVVHVVKYLFASGDRTVELTCSCSVSREPIYSPLFHNMAISLEFTEGVV